MDDNEVKAKLTPEERKERRKQKQRERAKIRYNNDKRKYIDKSLERYYANRETILQRSRDQRAELRRLQQIEEEYKKLKKD